MKKTVFISSTYEDLAQHRRAVWEMLDEFNVSVRGMERFGARTTAPLETCLAEVEQSDVYVGIVAFRTGSIDAQSGKSFTQLEYEHAERLGKEVLIYLADDAAARFRYVDIEIEPMAVERLKAFKGTLRGRHTVASFSTAEDLVDKLRRDIGHHVELRKKEEATGEARGEFEKTLVMVSRFLLMPKSAIGREVLMRASLTWAYPASRALCRAFNLEYGATIGTNIKVVQPKSPTMSDFTELYATGARANHLLSLIATKEPQDFFATLQFAEDDVPLTHGRFFGFRAYVGPEPEDYDPGGPYEYIPGQGKVILLFSKMAEAPTPEPPARTT